MDGSLGTDGRGRATLRGKIYRGNSTEGAEKENVNVREIVSGNGGYCVGRGCGTGWDGGVGQRVWDRGTKAGQRSEC